MNPFWVITGGAGFIGSNIVAALSARGHDVVVIDRLRDAASGKWRNLAKRALMDSIHPDETFGFLNAHAHHVAGIIHMGAISATTEPDADLIFRTNFTFSKAIWDWCTVHQKPLIYASSAATYGGGEQGFSDAGGFRAHSELFPLNAYGTSKKWFDLHVLREVERNHPAPPQWVGLKFFNVYGPNEYHKGSMQSVVAQIVPKIKAGEEVTLFRSHHPDYADGGQLRDFVYVKDCAAVVEWLVGNPEVSGIFNLGTGQARSFADLARAAFEAAGKTERIHYTDTPEVIRGQYQYFTEAKMEKLRAAGYTQSFHTLEAGITDYVRGYLLAADAYV